MIMVKQKARPIEQATHVTHLQPRYWEQTLPAYFDLNTPQLRFDWLSVLTEWRWANLTNGNEET